MNPVPMPGRPAGVTDEDIYSGLYRFDYGPAGLPHRATILFSGSAHRAAREAATELAEHWGVSTELWSVTSYKRLREEGMEAERHNRLHPS